MSYLCSYDEEHGISEYHRNKVQVTNFPNASYSLYLRALAEYAKTYPEKKEQLFIASDAYDCRGRYLPGYSALRFREEKEYREDLSKFWAILERIREDDLAGKVKLRIDGQIVYATSVEILSVPVKDDGREDIHIRQFTRGSQGEVREVAVVRRKVYDAVTEVLNPRMCADIPIFEKKYKWIWYRRLRWELRIDEKTNDLYITLPGEDMMLFYHTKCGVDRDEQCQKHGWTEQEEK